VSPRESRLAKNQELFRELNDRIAELAAKWRHSDMGLYCECSTTGCTEMIFVPADEYERVRTQPGTFLITPGHLVPESERVVSQHEGYDIIELAQPPSTGPRDASDQAV
jgi:hypothetical protein